MTTTDVALEAGEAVVVFRDEVEEMVETQRTQSLPTTGTSGVSGVVDKSHLKSECMKMPSSTYCDHCKMNGHISSICLKKMRGK